MPRLPEKYINELYQIIADLETVEDCKALFEDLCTNNEIENMAQRIYAAKLLKNGETYSSVMEKTSLASATVARVSNCVKYGKGYDKFIK